MKFGACCRASDKPTRAALFCRKIDLDCHNNARVVLGTKWCRWMGYPGYSIDAKASAEEVAPGELEEVEEFGRGTEVNEEEGEGILELEADGEPDELSWRVGEGGMRLGRGG